MEMNSEKLGYHYVLLTCSWKEKQFVLMDFPGQQIICSIVKSLCKQKLHVNIRLTVIKITFSLSIGTNNIHNWNA